MNLRRAELGRDFDQVTDGRGDDGKHLLGQLLLAGLDRILVHEGGFLHAVHQFGGHPAKNRSRRLLGLLDL
ncbi:hypothetical protein QUT90_22485, partial [Xanthomonas citri pv. citri]